MKRQSVFAALLAAIVLTLVVAVVALAAPATGDPSGVYVSNVYPAADASGLVTVLALYPNNNAQEYSYYLGKDAPVVEVGTWESTGDAVTLTLTGTPEKAYDKPSVTVYQRDGDALVDGLFVLNKLTEVTPAEMDAGTVAAPSDVAPTSEDPSGTYVSNVYPAADASGMLQVLSMFDNNVAQMSSIYLGKDAPIDEIGTWKLTKDGAVAVTLTGTAEKKYSKPAVTTYTRSGDALVDGVFVLNLLDTITPEEMNAMVAAQGTDPSGTYVSSVYPAADGPGLITVLALFPNNNAEQTSIYLTKGAIGEIGTWELGAGNALTVTLTGTPDKKYEKPATSVYKLDGETLTDGPFVLNKLHEITPAEMDAMTAPEPTVTLEPVAFFQSDVMLAADSPGRVISLTVYSDGTIAMSTDFMNDEPPIEEVGTWEIGADDRLTISITGAPDGEYAKPDVIIFEKQDDQIVAVEYDKAMWGSEGLTLTEKPLAEMNK